jgi:hypothetical protein
VRHNGANQLQEAAMAERERPANWEDWKWLHRWPRLTSIEWVLEWLVYWCRGLAIFEVLEFAGRASVLVAVIWWFWEADDRTKQDHYRAWELINSARGSTGDGGRRDALQDLNEDGVSLVAAPLADAYLVEVKLPGANLTTADLSRADLTNANLSGAKLVKAKLPKANLTTVDLSNAKLIGADLSGATLYGTNLTTANLSGANLASAILSGTDETSLDLTSVTFCQTTMPDGTLNNRDCPPESPPPAPSETPPAPN